MFKGAQTLSAGDFLQLIKFIGSEATVHFLRVIDHLFDILNSRNPLAKCLKPPIKHSN